MTRTSAHPPAVLHSAVLRLCNDMRARDIGRARPWWSRREDSLWYELSSCILGSRVAYEHALAAAKHLKRLGLMRAPKLQNNLRRYETNLVAALSRPIYPSARGHGRQRYRYFRLRPNHMRRTAEAIYRNGQTIRALLKGSRDAYDARDRLTRSAVGIGPKQASLFLRNVGFTEDLAVLDSHVLEYMGWMGLPTNSTDKIGRMQYYRETENEFRAYAMRVGYSVANVDLAVWVVARVVAREHSK